MNLVPSAEVCVFSPNAPPEFTMMPCALVSQFIDETLDTHVAFEFLAPDDDPDQPDVPMMLLLSASSHGERNLYFNMLSRTGALGQMPEGLNVRGNCIVITSRAYQDIYIDRVYNTPTEGDE